MQQRCATLAGQSADNYMLYAVPAMAHEAITANLEAKTVKSYTLEIVYCIASASCTRTILAVSRATGVFSVERRRPQSSREAKTAISPERSLFCKIRELKSKKTP